MAEVRIEDIKPNSKSYKAGQEARPSERPKVTPLVKASDVVRPKDSFGKKFVKSFIAKDVDDIKDYVIKDCLIPGVQSAILNMLSMYFYGESYDRGGKRDYGSYYGRSYYSGSKRDKEDRRERERERDRRNEKVDPCNIVLYERANAERVVANMRARIRETGGVSIAELLAMIDAPSEYTDTSYGWLDERDVGIKKVSKGYLIDVTEPRYLN